MTKSMRTAMVLAHWGSLLLFAMALFVGSPGAWAQSLSARVHACAAETDPGRRLACFDKNVVPFAEPAPPGDSQRATAPECCGKAPGPSAPVEAGVHTEPGAARPDQSHPADEHPQAKSGTVQKDPRHLSARLVSIEELQGAVLLHLDNGQVWQELQEPTADMNLRAGDTVTIERNLLGSYWLGGRSAGVVKVKRKE